MLNLMQGVADYGTAVRLRSRYQLTARIAGKTGTTNNNSDGWFIGIVPKLVAGGWTGAEERSIHFNTTAMGGGHNAVLPIWAEFMLQVYADSTLGITQEDLFEAPEGFSISLNCNDEQYAGEEEEAYDVPEFSGY